MPTFARFRRGAGASFGLCRLIARIMPMRAIILGPLRSATSVCFLEQSGNAPKARELRLLTQCMDRLRFAIEIVRGVRKSLICIRPV